jgi:N-acetylmuramoyl-L-alanine amidase
MRRIVPFSLILLASGVVAGCANTPTPRTAPAPARTPAAGKGGGARISRAPLPPVNPKLPPVPEVDGSLHITVIYPPAGALIGSRDSNFVFGSVGNGSAGLTINGALVPVWPNGAFMGWVANPPVDKQSYTLIAYTAKDTVRDVHPVRTRAALPPPSGPPRRDTVTPIRPPVVVVLRDDSLAGATDDTDQAIIGRPSPSGTYRWFLFPGTIGQMTGVFGAMAHVQLDPHQQIWVARHDAHPASDVSPAPVRVSLPQLLPQHDWIDLRLGVSSPPAYVVDETERSVTLTLYNTTGVTGDTLITSADPYLTDVRIHADASRVTYTFTCSRPVYGYLTLYQDSVMTFRLRRPPTVDTAHPLRGLTIAIDPGHPPAGATGPTGLYEADATLSVGLRVRDMLAAQGATVVMTRTTPDPVALGDRPIIARRADVNALVSIHLNALPDGMNPFHSNGTGTYYFHTHSQRFATLMQQSLVPQLGLRNLGTFRENLALVRPTWMPAVLTEGVFIIMPDQEAAMRTPEYQDAYARGVVNGLERFFATFAQ